MALQLRDYQTQAVDALWNALAGEGNPLVVLPTGTGKSMCIAEFIRRALAAYPDTKILVLTHSRELVGQNFAEMMGLWPECPAGIYSAGLNRRDLRSRVIFGSIQSIHRHAYALQRVDLVIVDEAQSIPRNTETTWRRFLGELLQINPYLKVAGLTATAYRLDSGMLHKGEGALFTEICYEYNIIDAIGSGYLSPLVSTAGGAQIDTAGVATRGGEFVAGQLDAAASDPDTVERIADEIVRSGADRRGWIIFGCGVHHCTMLRDAVRARGATCEGVFATTPLPERDSIIARFKRQEIRALVSVSALTTGFNAKHVDLVALARPTKSAGLYVQAVGRGTRLHPGKENCLVLDFGGNLHRFGPVDKPRVKDAPGEGTGEMPTKACPKCGGDNLIAARECVHCGAAFETVGAKVTVAASSAAILSTQIRPEWAEVSDVAYRKHEKPGKPPSLCVQYRCGLQFYREWGCAEHAGYARQKFVDWWKRRAPCVAVPNTVDEALSMVGALKKPTKILVRPSGRFLEIVGASFE